LDKRGPDLLRRVVVVYTTITQSQIFVLDQDEALEFYVSVLGLEVHTDADLGFMRWLTVNVPGEKSRQILLERPGPPAMDEATAEQVGDLLSKGAGGGWLALATDDAHGTYEILLSRGVDITDEPTHKPYGSTSGSATRSATAYGSGSSTRREDTSAL
jgi:catechol 2,3-dioxygenase-like lactoylglutathione lyase family enzyme